MSSSNHRTESTHTERNVLVRALSIGFAGFFLVLSAVACTDTTGPRVGSDADLLVRLNALPGVEAREIDPFYGYPRAFSLDITQPVDHDNPTGPTFTQRAYLSHVNDSTPMVFAPSGYGTSPAAGQELAGLLQTNHVSVAHRYFPDARPDPVDWDYLTIRQAAADHHRIVRLLKEIYVGRWVSTGASKGGETVLFHRRFYPDDVDATVAYVAPLLLSAEDPRFLPYLRSRGTALDRTAVFGFQRMLLERKEELLPYFRDWFSQRGLAMSLSLAPTFEDEVASYEWGFWQRHLFGRTDIPGPNAGAEELVDHLAIVVRLHFTSDEYRDYFRAYVYQGLTEIGLPYFRADHLEDLFTEEEVDVWTTYSFPPDLQFHYRPEVIPDIIEWVRTWGDEIILIYGEDDPWTAGALDLTGQTDALKVVQVGADHGVRITDLDQRDLVLEKLGDWLELDLGGIAFQEILVPQRLTRPPEADLRLLDLF